MEWGQTLAIAPSLALVLTSPINSKSARRPSAEGYAGFATSVGLRPPCSQTQRRFLILIGRALLILIAARYAASGHTRRRRSCDMIREASSREVSSYGFWPGKGLSQGTIFSMSIRIRWVTATPRSARCRVLRPEACST